MRGYSKAVLAFGLIAAFSTPAWAQGRGGFGGGGMMGGVANLISNESVQKEIKLEDDQVEKAKGVSEELRSKMRESFSAFQDLEPAERTKKMQELNRTTNEEGMKAVSTFLKPEQLKRLKQISLQQQGASALADSHVAKKLKVSDEQTGKIHAIMAESGTMMREAMQAAGDDRAAAMEKMRSLRKETNEKALAVLTDDQKKEWKEMLGEHFELKMEARPSGARRNNNN